MDAIALPMPQAGTYVIGGTGSGKSSYLALRMLADAEAGKGFVLIDPKGNTSPKDSLADRVAGHLKRPFVVLDVASANFGINPLFCATPEDRFAVDDVADAAMEMFVRVFELDPTVTTQLYAYLLNATIPLIVTQTPMAKLNTVLVDRGYRDQLLGQLPRYDYDEVLAFWGHHESLPPHDKNSLIGSTFVRVLRFFTNARAKRIFGVRETTLDWTAAMATSQIVFVRLSPRQPQLSQMVGTVALAQIAGAAFGRSERTPFAVYCDEYHRYATSATDELLTMGRGFGIETTIAHQTRAQLSNQTKGATLQAGNLVIFRVGVPDNGELAGMFKVPEEEPRIIGRMARQTAAHDPIHQILSGKHDSPEIQRLARERLLPWIDRTNQHATEAQRTDGMRLLNAYLTDLMNRTIAVGSIAEADRVAAIVYSFAVKHEAISRTYYPPEHYQALVESARRAAHGDASWEPLLTVRAGAYAEEALFWLQRQRTGFPDWSMHWEWEYLNPERQARLRPYVRYLREQEYATSLPVRQAYDVWWQLHNEQKAEYEREFPARAAQAPIVGRQKAREELERDILWMFELGRLLASQPLMVDTDLSEPIHERERSVSDRIADFANELPGLGLGEAWVKIWRGRDFVEARVTLPPPPEPTGWRFVPSVVEERYFDEESEDPVVELPSTLKKRGPAPI